MHKLRMLVKINYFNLIEIKFQFAKYFLDGMIGRLTWGKIMKPQLEDRTIYFKLNESVTHLSGLSKAQYAEIGYNPIRNEFELVCVYITC